MPAANCIWDEASATCHTTMWQLRNAPRDPTEARPWGGLPACSSADARTGLDRVQAVHYPDDGDGKGRDDDHCSDGPGQVPARLGYGTATVATLGTATVATLGTATVATLGTPVVWLDVDLAHEHLLSTPCRSGPAGLLCHVPASRRVCLCRTWPGYTTSGTAATTQMVSNGLPEWAICAALRTSAPARGRLACATVVERAPV